MKRVLVTGADGFTGRYLCPLLSARGFEVHGLDPHLPSTPPRGVARMHVADLTDARSVARAVSAANPKYVVHLGGISFIVGDAEPMYEVNLLGTRRLLEALCSLSEKPNAVLLASSANIYGNATGGVLAETTRPAPANDYAVSKLAMEHVARLYSARLPLIICRPFNYTGVGQMDTFLLPKIVAHIRRRAPSIELGNLDVARDFSDVRDVSATYAQLLEEPRAVNETLNVCSGRAYTLREVLQMTEEISGWSMQIRVNADLIRPNEVKMLLGSRARLDALVAATVPRIALLETLRWMIETPADA
jgi:nucleoside-diphosphate-sugar epimerase